MKRCAFIMAMTLASVACSATTPTRDFNAVELARGQHSHQTSQRMELVTSQNHLLQVWRELDGRMPPAIDFTVYSVIAVFMGQRSSGGYSVDIGPVRVSGDRLEVHVVMRAPGPGCMTTQALTQPYYLAVIPVHSGTVEFRSSLTEVACP